MRLSTLKWSNEKTLNNNTTYETIVVPHLMVSFPKMFANLNQKQCLTIAFSMKFTAETDVVTAEHVV